MRCKSKVIDITNKTTKNDIEAEINTQLTKGWIFMQIFTHPSAGNKVFAVFIKELSG